MRSAGALKPEARLADILRDAIVATADAYVYDVTSDAMAGPDTLLVKADARVGPHRVDLLVGLRFHGAEFRIAIACDPADFHEKAPADSERDLIRDRSLRHFGALPLRFTRSEISAFPGLCADQVLNLIMDFQTAHIRHAMAGAA